ncbi:hypothetical protein [Neobacillus bataviensis]|uniref:hypothetical protein n=1 Tax=Neobacillus bataviensis TaxID=220685 RepID=UPI001CBEFC44|nr:hypothetical protein [Neobacillus bataviensis]
MNLQYQPNVKNGKYQFQIIIKDIYDLLLTINDKDCDELTKIHDYIDENINKYVEHIKKPFYNFEPTKIMGFTAKSFVKYFDVEPSQYKEFIKDLQKFAYI